MVTDQIFQISKPGFINKKIQSMKLKRLLALLQVIFALTVSLNVFAQQVTVKGKITDSKTSLPLAGATIKVKNGGASAVSDANGTFTIKAPSSESVISITYVGYKVYETKVGTGDLSIQLESSGADLNEVVVIGYGTQLKRKTTGSMATIDMPKIAELPVSNLAEALKGQIPGLNVSGGSQRPGENATLSIRQNFGYSKDGNSQVPLVVIDDIIQLDPNTGLPTLEQFNNLDPSQVESITVLRDASAAIYGSRASQGAIIVKTKRGKIGAPKISYSGKFEMNDAVSHGKMMSAYEYGIFTNRYGRSAGWTASNMFDNNELESLKTLNYDWLKEAWSAGGAMQHSIDVSGGAERATYFAGASFYTQKPNLGSQDYKKWSFRSGIDVKVANGLKFSATLGVNNAKIEKSFTKTSVNDGSYTSGSEQTDYVALLHMPKYIPWQYSVSGVTNYTSPALGTFRANTTPVGQNNISGWNYFAMLNNGSYTRDDNNSYSTSLSLNYEVPYVKGLSLKATYGYNYSISNSDQAMLGVILSIQKNTNTTGLHLYKDSAALWFTALNNNRSTVRFSDVMGKVQQGNFFVNYDRKFGLHSISAMVSVEKGIQNYVKNFQIYDNPNYGAFNGSSPSAGTLNVSNSFVFKTDFGSLGYLGRLDYDYDGKYMVQFAFREDASTKFSPDHYWGFFPGVSAGWVISSEKWFPKQLDWVNFLKIRGSVAKTGKDNVKAWRWMQTMSYAADKAFTFGSNGGAIGPALTPDAAPNPDLMWDTDIKKNIGFDIALLNSRLTFTYDRYLDNNRGLLMTMASMVGVPVTVGGGFAEQNYGNVKAWGSEYSLTWRDKVKNFGYSVGINFGRSDNEITKWYDVAFNYPSLIKEQVGSSTNRPTYGFTTWKNTSSGDGMLRTDADIDAYWSYLSAYATAAGTTPEYLGITTKAGLKKGMLAYVDLAGALDANKKTIAGPNGKILAEQDYTVLSKRNSNYGIVTNINLSWKSISLNTQIATSWGGFTSVDYIKQSTSSSQMFWAKESYLNDMYDSTDNPNGKWPNVAQYDYNNQNSDFWKISSFRSFVRSLSVAYSLPKKITSKMHMEALRFSLAGFNLWDFHNPYPDKYRNMFDDPKVSYPTLRTWALGINATF